MAEHLLRIGALRTDVAVLATPETAAPLRGRLDRALSARLPPLLAELSGPILDRFDGVIRLRRLRIDLDHAGTFDETTLARLLAARIAAALRDALARPGAGDLRAWADQSSYLAAYVETRLGLDPGPDWPFAEFKALSLLSPSEATAEMLRSRPGVLAQLARNGAGSGDPTRLLRRLDDTACAATLAALADGRHHSDHTPELVRLAEADDLADAFTGPGRLPRKALALLLRDAAAAPQRRDHPPPVRSAMAVVALGELARTSQGRIGGPLTVQDVTSSLGEEMGSLPHMFGSALRASLTDPSHRAALAGLLTRLAAHRDVRPGAPPTPATEAADAAPAEVRRVEARRCVSPVAGVALLLSGVARYDAQRVLTPAQLRAAVISTLTIPGEDHAPSGTATDPLLHALLPADPHAGLGVVPPVPGTVLDGLAPEVRGLTTGRDGPEGWGDLLLATFADRLPGLRASSRGYLQRQFLFVPGRLDLSDELAQVTLEGPPLAVVLAMAGFDGAQGPLPHLGDRLLTMVLTGLRR